MKTQSRVTLTGGFWKAKQEMNLKATLPGVYNRFYETGRIPAFDYSLPWEEGKCPHIFWDSDVAKWIEGVAYQIEIAPCPDLREKAEKIIADILRYQGEDGYFNLYFQRVEPDKRYTNRKCHELYCAGHLMEAAVAWYEATGSREFLDAMEKYAAYIDRVFRVEGSAAFETPGHEEIELALFRMYRTTGNRRWLELSAFFLNRRGANEKDRAGVDRKEAAGNQSHLPIREQREALGHSVRALYLASAMVDLAVEEKDAVLLDTCRALFDDIAEKKMYITGGVGSTNIGEAFTIPFDLPNETAYTETCAAIALVFFTRRMTAADPANAAKYADVLERALYNGVLSGVSLSGTAFFYENPLSYHLKNRTRLTSTLKTERYPAVTRPEVFSCSCCPPNICRLLPSIGRYFFTEEGDTVCLWQYADCHAEFSSGGSLSVSTDYPVSGEVTIKANGISALRLRIPGWCDEFTCDTPYTDAGDGTILIANPATVRLSLSMRAKLIDANADVWADGGRCAVTRGPLVYCAEAVDNGDPLTAVTLSETLHAEAEYSPLFGADILSVDGWRRVKGDKLYTEHTGAGERIRVRLIPYYAMENRGATDMTVWFPVCRA